MRAAAPLWLWLWGETRDEAGHKKKERAHDTLAMRRHRDHRDRSLPERESPPPNQHKHQRRSCKTNTNTTFLLKKEPPRPRVLAVCRTPLLSWRRCRCAAATTRRTREPHESHEGEGAGPTRAQPHTARPQGHGQTNKTSSRHVRTTLKSATVRRTRMLKQEQGQTIRRRRRARGLTLDRASAIVSRRRGRRGIEGVSHLINPAWKKIGGKSTSHMRTTLHSGE
jgi:hypothetical protein